MTQSCELFRPTVGELTSTDKAIIMERWLKSKLRPTQHIVFGFIFDRTVWWNKEWEIVTANQIRSGVRTSDERLVHTGTGLARSTINEALSFLVQEGYLAREWTRQSNGRYAEAGELYYRYSICWEHIVAQVAQWPMGMSWNRESDRNQSVDCE